MPLPRSRIRWAVLAGLVSVVAAGTGSPVFASVAAAPAAQRPAPAVRAEPLWFWEWTDGSTARMRDLAEVRYPSWSDLPGLVIASTPATPGSRIALQVRAHGRWVVEDVATTGPDGRAILRINPYCADGDWCDGRSDYRLVVAGAQAPLQVHLIPRG
jgi:hypothetical protein